MTVSGKRERENTMTRKDYRMIAAVVKHHYDIEGSEDERRTMAGRLSMAFSQENPLFKPIVFMEACGV